MEPRINEGYTITDSLHIGGTEFVIGENRTQHGTMYVTWECRDSSNFYWGHYLTDRRAAEKDLMKRAGRELGYQMQKKEKAEQPQKETEYER